MRDRPPRFDEVRTINPKSRKGSKGRVIGGLNGIGNSTAARLKKDRGVSSPNAAVARVGSGEMHSRRGSNSSNTSGNSDWDESLATFQSQRRQQHHGSSTSLSGGEFPFSTFGQHAGQQSQFSPPPGSHFSVGTGTGGFGHPHGGGSHPHAIHSGSLDSASPIRLPHAPALPGSFPNGSSSLSVGGDDLRIRRKSATSPAPLPLHSPSPSILSNMGTFGSYPSTPDLSAGLGSLGLGNGGGPPPEFSATNAGGADVSGRKSQASSRVSSSVENSPYMNTGKILQQQQHATTPLSSSAIQQGARAA